MRSGLLLALAILLAACTASGPSARLESAEPIDAGDAVELRQQLQLRQAEFVTTCMLERGHEYEAPVLEPPLEFLAATKLPEDERIRSIGYGIVAVQRLASAENRAAQESLPTFATIEESESFLTDLYGSSSGEQGCTGEAMARIEETYPDELRRMRESQTLDQAVVPADVAERVAASPTMVSLDGRWAECMAERGYDALTSPVEAQVRVFERLQAGPSIEEQGADVQVDGTQAADAADEHLNEVQAFEIDIATEDHDCRLELGYDETILELSGISTD